MPFREISDFTPQNQAGALCTFCGQHARPMYVGGRRARTFSTGVHIDHEGVIEICEQCMAEAGQTVGQISQAVAIELQQDITAVTELLDKAEADAEERRLTMLRLAGELALAAKDQAAKVAAAYDKGLRDAEDQITAGL